MRRKTLGISILVASAGLAQNPVTINIEPFATGLSGPVDIAHCGDERLFVVEQAGVIKIVSPEGEVASRPFLDIQDRVNDDGGEQGLLGLAFDPEYATNGRFYVNYISGTGNGTSRISRFRVTNDPDSADAATEEVLYTVEQPASNHNGGDLAFGPDGYLYIGFGDGGSGNDPWNNGQSLTNPLGDLLRIDVSGESGYAVPESNPWVGIGNDTLPEIWASGLRNPWRFGFDRETGDLWIGDVGQNQREEVNFVPAGEGGGLNFGWRCYEGDIATPNIDDDCPPASEFAAPVSVHTHGAGWCSVIGGRVYRGSEFPRLVGLYIYTDYCPAPYFALRPNGVGGWIREQVRSSNGGAGTSVIAENKAGDLFVANANSGTIRRIVDQCPMAPPEIVQNGSILTSSNALSYTWYLNGEVLPGVNTQVITPEIAGAYHVVAGLAGGCQLSSNTIEVVATAIGGHAADSFVAMPVPARDQLTLMGLPNGVGMVELIDQAGRVARRQSWNKGPRGVIDLDNLAEGMYMLRLLDGHGSVLQQRNVQVQH